MSIQTGSQTVGPYFRIGMIRGGENTLVQDETVGQRIYIKGQLLDGDGQPVNDGCIEIWQADAQGYFNHPADPNQAQADPNFRGFGRSETLGAGFWFKTIKPGVIAGAPTPYINVRVFSRGMLIHALTRLYFSDESANADDPLLNSVPPERRATLIAQRQEFGDVPTYRFDIHLQGDKETVFFNP
ncbi:MAG: protocatechuate 3,4-dioxygenase subunit alpha [Anaerolineaceae bacterium]|nr:protocatechuate 3,4-dioxygenase subunit alpha [Anaerolineaceae bacterium]MCB9102604.1 protocatechuate 3,4-dioxygenase subunit alpha [Anaerolineales bacterium]